MDGNGRSPAKGEEAGTSSLVGDWGTGIKSHCEAEILILGIYSKEITKDIHGNTEWNILGYSSVTLKT